MMTFIQIIVSGIAATLAMTAFSYIISGITKKNFKEPQLLNILIERLSKKKSIAKREHIAGWLIHFSVGILFVLSFKILASIFYLPVTVTTGAVFGLIAGITGACSWSVILQLHPCPPANDRLLFYSQLVVAHIIFGIVMIEVLRNI